MQPAHRLPHQLGPDLELGHLPRGERLAVVPTRVGIQFAALSNTIPLTTRVGTRPGPFENPPRQIISTFRRIASERKTARRQTALQAQRRATRRRAAREAGGPFTRAAQP